MASSGISLPTAIIVPQPGHLRLSSHKYDIVLAAAARPGTGAEDKWPLYAGIGEIIGRLGKVAFLPHRDADIGTIGERELGQRMQRIISGSVDLVLYYAGIGSLAARIALITACDRNVPVTFFYEHCNQRLYEETVRSLELPQRTERIMFEKEDEALSRLEESLKMFYDDEVH